MNAIKFRKLSSEIDNFFCDKDEENGFKLLDEALKDSAEVPGWSAYFKGEFEGYKNKNYKTQENYYLEALAISVEETFFLRKMGICLSLQNRFEEALIWHNKSLSVDSSDIKSIFQYGITLAELSRFEESITWLDKALAINPEDAKTLRWRGIALSRLDREEEAITWFDKALAIDPEDSVALRSRGIALSKLDREEEAITWFDKALAICPDDSETLRWRGITLSNLDREEEAISWFDKALAVKQDDSEAFRWRGIALSKLNRDEEAIEWFDKALAIDSDDPETLLWRGIALTSLGNNSEAILWLDKALRLSPDDAETLRWKGIALSGLDREEEAITLFDKALAIEPEDAEALSWKGFSLSNLGNEAEAITWFDKALAIDPEDVVTLRWRGMALSNFGREEEAIAWFDKALSVDSNDVLSWRCKGISLLNLQKYTEAVAAFSEATKISPDAIDLKHEIALAKRLESKESSTTQNKIEDGLPVQKDFSKKVNFSRPQAQINFFEALRSVWQTAGSMEKFLDQSKEEQDRLDSFINDEGNFDQTRCFLLGLRKWNSYTPALPSKTRTFGAIDTNDRSIGGGYYLYYKGEGIVIDPGFNFIENFNTLGGTLSDIKHIIITHAHNDHTADLESILSLFYRRNSNSNSIQYGGPNLYLNIGAFQKFSPILNLHSSKHIGKVRVIAVGEEYNFGDLRLRILPAYHDEVLTKEYSIGLFFTFPNEISTNNGNNHDASGPQKSLLFTSDTGFVPKTPERIQFGQLSDGNVLDIATSYGILKPDFLIPHLGSIHPNEFTAVDDQDDCLEKIRKQELFYPNHLGFMGTAMLINKLRPKYVFLSEFGEELHGFLPDLMKLMKNCINKLMMQDAPKAFLPMDLLFCCDLQEETIYSQEEEKFIPVADADFAHCSKLDLFHFKSTKPVGRVYQAEHNIARFLEDIEHKRNFFFKQQTP